MRPHLRSALRVWTKRPAGPILLALGLTVATVLAGGTQLALDGAELAAEQRDARALGDGLGLVRTPGGFSLDETDLGELQTRLAEADGTDAPPERRFPLFLEREVIVTTEAGSSANWRVLGLPTASLEALGLPVPADGQALVDSGGPAVPGQAFVARVPQAPQENVTLASSRNGQLEQTTRVGDDYQHAEGDEYRFDLPVRQGAVRLDLFLSTADNDTDFDLEATAPDGTRYLDDEGTPAQPEMPRLAIEDPLPGNWTVEVHAKFAREVAFRLEVEETFEARDAQTLGRLLAGEGFHAIGAQLGLAEQAQATLEPRATSLQRLGPGSEGLIVVPLERLQRLTGTGPRADGLLVVAGPGESVLAGIDETTEATLRDEIAAFREEAGGRLDPRSGLELHAEADDRRQEREATLDSTARLLFVVLPAGVAAGVLLATWAAGLHTRRLASELRVMAGLGQSRRASLGLVAAHLGPPFLAGTAAALALAPLVGLAVAEGLGLASTPVLFPGLETLAVPVLALVPIAATAWGTLRGPVEGQDPSAGQRPPTRTRRWAAAAAWGLIALALAGGVLLGDAAPARAYLLASLAGSAAGLAILWAPALEAVLDRERSLSVANLGWFRTRSTHAQLGLAAATVTLVLAAMLAGTALSQAASPDPELESGGYPVVARTPTFTEELAALAPEEGPLAERADRLASDSLGTEFLMRVEGTGLHSAETGSEDRIYGIDRSFAQRHQHAVEPVDGVEDPLSRVAAREEAAVVSRDVWEALDEPRIFVHGPQGRLPYDVVGVVETRVLEGVYISQDALPAQFAQVAGEQRFLLGDTDPDAYAADLQETFKDAGMRATTAQALVDDELAGQQQAGTTLSAMAGLGAFTALGLVVLIGIRARAERRTSDAVLVAMGSPTRSLAAGIAVETALPLVVAALIAAAVLLPAAGTLEALEGLAFPLLPIDETALVARAALLLAGLLALTIALSAAIGLRAVRGLDQQALRELE